MADPVDLFGRELREHPRIPVVDDGQAQSPFRREEVVDRNSATIGRVVGSLPRNPNRAAAVAIVFTGEEFDTSV
jgi:hypothetical protein